LLVSVFVIPILSIPVLHVQSEIILVSFCLVGDDDAGKDGGKVEDVEAVDENQP